MTRTRWLLAAILAVGLLLRMTYLLEVARAPDFDAPQFEAQYHDYWARALVSGDWTPPAGVTDPEIPQRPYFRPPGYSFALAGIYRLIGGNYFWPRLLQMGLGLASCLLLYRLARQGFGRPTALFTASLGSVYWVFLFFEAELMAVSLLIFLLLAALSLAAGWRQEFTIPRALGVGGLIGLAILVRPNAAVLLPVLLLWFGGMSWRRSGRSSLLQGAFLKPALTLIAVTLLVTAPATVRNYRVAQDLVWVTSNAGVNLFVGSHPESDGIRPGVTELGEIAGLDGGWDSFDYPKVAAGVERVVGRPMTDSEISSYFSGRALAYAAAQPGDMARLTLRKLALFWGPVEISNNKVIEVARETSPTLSLSPGFATILALALLGLGGLIWERRSSTVETEELRQRLEIGVLLLLFMAFYSASFLPFFVSARFRAPVVPILMIFAGHALAELWRALAGQRYRQLAAGVAGIVVLRVLTGIAWVPYEPDRALWHWRQGLLWKARGQGPEALQAFQLAAAANPAHAETRLSLAETLAAAGRLDEARLEYQATLELKATTATQITAHNNLARLLAGRGDLDAAIDHWQTVLDLAPERVSALNNLAYALATHPDSERRDPEQAIDLAERACELTGHSDPRPLAALAAAYSAAGRDADAEAVRERAARLTGRPLP